MSELWLQRGFRAKKGIWKKACHLVTNKDCEVNFNLRNIMSKMKKERCKQTKLVPELWFWRGLREEKGHPETRIFLFATP